MKRTRAQQFSEKNINDDCSVWIESVLCLSTSDGFSYSLFSRFFAHLCHSNVFFLFNMFFFHVDSDFLQDAFCVFVFFKYPNDFNCNFSDDFVSFTLSFSLSFWHVALVSWRSVFHYRHCPVVNHKPGDKNTQFFFCFWWPWLS